MTNLHRFFLGCHLSRPRRVAQDAGNLASNRDLIRLRESAKRLRMADIIAAPLPDTHNPLLIMHSFCDGDASTMAITPG
jgi:hypothetical protein